MSGRLPLILVALAACGRDRVTSCADPLGGVWVAGDHRWLMQDHGLSLEAYSMAPDAEGPSELVTAPRSLALTRDDHGRVSGELRRRYMRRAESCEAHVSVHVTACRDDALELVLSDPLPPLGFAPCTWPPREPARVERWHHE